MCETVYRVAENFFAAMFFPIIDKFSFNLTCLRLDYLFFSGPVESLYILKHFFILKTCFYLQRS